MRLPAIALATVFVSTPCLLAADPPLAWIEFSRQAEEKYEDVPYLWLGDQAIYLTIDVPPADGHVLDLLWGSKHDQRGAEIVVNDKRQRLEAGGYNGFQWQRAKPPAGVTGEKYELLLQAAQPKAAFIAAVRLSEADAPLDQPLPDAPAHRIEIAQPPPHALDLWMQCLPTKTSTTGSGPRFTADRPTKHCGDAASTSTAGWPMPIPGRA